MSDPVAKYQRTVGILVLSGRASTSYISRVLEISYQEAVELMGRAEVEGIVSRPDDVGKRTVLARPID